MGLGIELPEGDAGLEELFGIGQGLELLVGRHHEFVRVAFALTPLSIGCGFGEQARSVEIDVRVQVRLVKGVDQSGEALRDMAVAQVLTDDGAIL